ncbi:MAG: DNA polymerase III subunit delta' [Gammaproteobacteria bacterium]|nr:DNA polymerase III subunit delta' [Gammaproteobacteria bacterium]
MTTIIGESVFLPWHQELRVQLQEAIDGDRLPHALLLRGARGLGKGLFAEVVARGLLCQTNELKACGVCRSCVLLASGNHPDYFHIRPEEDKKQIRVEQIRDLIGRLILTSQMQGYKVAVIKPADAMNTNAQNSLLKTLEEPPAKTVLLLVSSDAAALAPTVLSRCQSLRFANPDTNVALAWLDGQGDADWPQLLQLAWGAPLLAVELDRQGAAEIGQTLADDLKALLEGRCDPVSTAESWAGDQLDLRMRWLQQQVYGVIQWQILGLAPELVHKTLQRSLQNSISALSLTESFRYLDRLQYAIGLADRAVNQALAILPILSVWADGPRFEQIVADQL